ncbi:MAG: hypothetical protein ABF289_05475 [Clostridiales bacterium]
MQSNWSSNIIAISTDLERSMTVMIALNLGIEKYISIEPFEEG